MNPADESMLPYDPLDDTKVWDEKQYPLLHVGRLTLNRNPDNHLEQVEKLAFAPANLVDGIELSDDKMLQGRAIVYSDAQRHRLGNDFRKIPVNRQANWSPSSMRDSGNGRQIEGTIGRSSIPKQDDFTQAGQHYNSLSELQKYNLTGNLAAELSAASAENQRTVLGYLYNASPDMANRVYQNIVQYESNRWM
jgi:catalase